MTPANDNRRDHVVDVLVICLLLVALAVVPLAFALFDPPQMPWSKMR